MKNDYVYAVARVRHKELGLLNAAFIDQLITSNSYDDCLNLLAEKGWQGADTAKSAVELLAQQRQQTWDFIAELAEDMSDFDVFLYANDYHNLKAAIKLVCTNAKVEGIFSENATIDPELIMQAVKDHNYSLLPDEMKAPAEEAYTALLQARDGQLCDVIIDKAALEAVLAEGKKSADETIRLYAELTVASANIKTAVRCIKTAKNLEFIKRALAKCDTLNADMLAHAAANGMDALKEYLQKTQYSNVVGLLDQSTTAVERWFDNHLIEKIKPQKMNPFSIGPLVAYIIARENEIKTVRIILSGKLNEMSEDKIQERVRDMYV